MRRAGWAILLGILAQACTERAPAAIDAGAPLKVAAEVADAAIEPMQGALLDRYIAYRRQMLAVQRKLLPQMDALEVKARKAKDAGTLAEAGLSLMTQESQAEETARLRSGLSPKEISRLDEEVDRLVAAKEAADDAAPEAQLSKLEAVAKKVPPDAKATLEKSISDLKAARAQAQALTDLRAQYGDAEVDLLLTREQELRRLWNEWLQVMAGEAK